MSEANLTRLNDLVLRVTADNPGPMTGAGTNSYLVGKDELLVIDPGPDLPSHLQAIETAAAGRPIRWIAVTHTHMDHSPAAAELAKATGAQLIGSVAVDDDFQDKTFTPDIHLQHGQRLSLGGNGQQTISLTAVHTPGHVSNHYCFWLPEQGMMFTGDHLINGSTVVIIPPGGDMKDYLASLELLLQYPMQSIAPGHGDVIASPLQEVQRIIDHRLQREGKVRTVMQSLRQGTLEELTPQVYNDVDPALHPVAHFSLWAHLIKLQKQGEVSENDGLWAIR